MNTVIWGYGTYVAEEFCSLLKKPHQTSLCEVPSWTNSVLIWGQDIIGHRRLLQDIRGDVLSGWKGADYFTTSEFSNVSQCLLNHELCLNTSNLFLGIMSNYSRFIQMWNENVLNIFTCSNIDNNTIYLPKLHSSKKKIPFELFAY